MVSFFPDVLRRQLPPSSVQPQVNATGCQTTVHRPQTQGHSKLHAVCTEKHARRAHPPPRRRDKRCEPRTEVTPPAMYMRVQIDEHVHVYISLCCQCIYRVQRMEFRLPRWFTAHTPKGKHLRTPCNSATKMRCRPRACRGSLLDRKAFVKDQASTCRMRTPFSSKAMERVGFSLCPSRS